MSSLDLEPNAEFSQLFFNKSADPLYKDFLSLNIYFSSMKYTEIRQTPKMNIIDLKSNLGGALGIFLGFSVFSLIEILEVIVKVIGILLRRQEKP